MTTSCLGEILNLAVNAVGVATAFALASLGWYGLKRMIRGEK